LPWETVYYGCGCERRYLLKLNQNSNSQWWQRLITCNYSIFFKVQNK